jgi:hypothetical protein
MRETHFILTCTFCLRRVARQKTVRERFVFHVRTFSNFWLPQGGVSVTFLQHPWGDKPESVSKDDEPKDERNQARSQQVRSNGEAGEPILGWGGENARAKAAQKRAETGGEWSPEACAGSVAACVAQPRSLAKLATSDHCRQRYVKRA